MPLLAVRVKLAVALTPAVTVGVAAAGDVNPAFVAVTEYVPGGTPLNVYPPLELVVVVPLPVVLPVPMYETVAPPTGCGVVCESLTAPLIPLVAVRVKLAVAVLPDVTFGVCAAGDVNPLCVAVTEYGPGGTPLKVYKQLELVVMVTLPVVPPVPL